MEERLYGARVPAVGSRRMPVQVEHAVLDYKARATITTFKRTSNDLTTQKFSRNGGVFASGYGAALAAEVVARQAARDLQTEAQREALEHWDPPDAEAAFCAALAAGLPLPAHEVIKPHSHEFKWNLLHLSVQWASVPALH